MTGNSWNDSDDDRDFARWDSDEWDDGDQADRGHAWDSWEEDDDGEDLATIPCPTCGQEVVEDVVRCFACGTYISRDTSPWSGRPWWWIALGILGVIMVILGLAGAGLTW